MNFKATWIDLYQLLPLQSLWRIFAWVVSLAILIFIWLILPSHLYQYIFLLRVPIFFGAILFGFPILANTVATALFQNLFVMRGRWQIATVMVSSTMAGLIVSCFFASILTYAPIRFNLPPLITLPIAFQYGLTAIFILPIWLFTIRLSTIELGKKIVFLGSLFGIIGSLALIWVINWAESVLQSWQECKQFLASLIFFFAKQHPQGYLDTQNRLTTGHLLEVALALIGLLVYVIVITLYRPTEKQSLGEAPALLYLLLLIWIGTLLLSGATFYADYFYVPIIIYFVLFSGCVYALFGVDHFYHIRDIDSSLDESRQEDLVNFGQAINERLKHQTRERTLVVICASGGGIQAAGWTAQVLKGLQEELSSSFTKAIGLISSVSGGSVGSMYFVDRIDPTVGYPQPNSLAQIFTSATEDSLDAIGWGLAGSDFLRAIGFPFLVNKYSDRAEAMELGWQRKMKHPQATLSNKRKQILQGEVPIHVANATLVEDGRRLLISPMQFIQNNKDRKAIDFNSLYPDCDLNVTTVARLSATFPYVTPNARNDRHVEGKNYHIADGGYFDNTGLFTAVEWLDEWLDPNKDPKIDRVLMLQISAFPDPKSQPSNGDGGWWTALFGPLKTLSSVRDSTQMDRNLREVEFLKQRWKDRVEIEQFTIFFPSQQFDRPNKKFNQSSGKYDNFKTKNKFSQPLSWRLTKGQKQNLTDGWKSLLDDSNGNIHEIKKIWLDRWKMGEYSGSSSGGYID
jgi:hypothetical protein